MYFNSISASLLETLKGKGLTLATAESCTGGNIAHHVTLIPGSSEVFMGGAVVYSNEAKIRVLSVKGETLDTYGAVSEETVMEMVSGACKVFNTDCAIATSGIAGPGGGTVEKPVGTVWTAIKTPDGIFTDCLHLKGDREEIIDLTTWKMLQKLHEILVEGSDSFYLPG